MIPEQREELKKAALAADQDGQHMYTHPRDSNNWRRNDRFNAMASPAVILSLIAQVEALTVPDDYFAPVVLNPTCACAKCNPNAAGRMMIVCATCGNKRCPHATDHRLACTDSNEPGQAGSSYGPTIPAMPGAKEAES